MSKEKNEGQEDFLLKKIRYYQGSIADYETFWNQKIAQGESETSAETKACKTANAELNKAYEIIPVSKDDENEVKPLTKDEVEKAEKKVKKVKKEKCECDDDECEDKKCKKEKSKK